MIVRYFEVQGNPLELLVPETDHEKAVGLLAMNEAPDDRTGMWFKSHPWPRLHTMGMNFPIDIIWLDDALAVVYIDINIQPNQMIAPRGPIAIELAGGWALRNMGPNRP